MILYIESVIHSKSRIMDKHDVEELRSALYRPKGRTTAPLQEGVLEGNMNEVKTEAQERLGRINDKRKAETLVLEVEHLKQPNIEPCIAATKMLDLCR